MIRFLPVLFGVIWLSTGARTTPPQEQRVLFIGNSLTSMHDLPRMVEQLSVAGSARISTTTIARDGFSLDDHWERGEAARAIAAGGWSHVVLQQGPSALPESRTLLIAAVRRFDVAIRKAGARTAVYMVWPAEARARDFDAVRDSYAAAARDVDGLFLPAGEAWRAAWRRDSTLELYGSDRFHPTRSGSYLAALVISHGLTGRRPAVEPKGVTGWSTLVAAARDVESLSRHLPE